MKFKFTFLTLLIVLLIFDQTFSQQWEYVNSHTSFILYGMNFPPGQNDVGYAVGMQYTYDAPGVIVKTSNNGQTWAQIFPTTGEIDGLEAVCFTTPNNGFAAGWNNYFIKTTNGGTSWTPITVGTDVWYYADIKFWDENNGVAAAVMNSGGSRIYKTNNGGFSWTLGGSLAYSVLDICYADQNTLYAVGTGNVISRSVNGGQSFSNIYQSTGITMGVDFANINFGVIGGEDGKILTTNDGGSTWSSFSTGYHSFYAVHVFDKDSAYAAGTDEDIYKTTNSGASWSLAFNGSGNGSMYKLCFTENNTGFCSGSGGTMMRHDPPIATNFIADQTEICTGSQVQFTDLSVGATSWEWYFEGGTPETSNVQNPLIMYYQSGFFDVSLSASNAEQSQTTLMNDYITVYEQPQPMVTGIENVCINHVENYMTTAQENVTYDWETIGGEIISGQGSSAIQVLWGAESGVGNVIVNESINGNCIESDTLDVNIDLCSGVETKRSTTLQIFPNPVTNTLTISFQSIQNEAININIYTISGIKKIGKSIIGIGEVQQTNINVKDLSAGMYVVEIIRKSGETERVKFQKID